jgi:hypothetical protein
VTMCNLLAPILKQSPAFLHQFATMNDSISARGKAFAAQKPTFLDVLSDLWAPNSNPDGIVNIGLAENVRINYLRFSSC